MHRPRNVGQIAEQVYTTELADGYPAPLSDVAVDGDPHIDIYVDSSLVAGPEAGQATPDTSGVPSSGFIAVRPTSDSMNTHVIAQQFFHLIQFGLYQFPTHANDWLAAATSEWMGYSVDGYNVIGELQARPRTQRHVARLLRRHPERHRLQHGRL